MPTPTSARRARKNASFWTIPATRRIALPKAPIIGLPTPKNKVTLAIKGGECRLSWLMNVIGRITMAKALIVYASRTGETQQIADLIAEGIRFSGHEAEVVESKAIKSEADLEGYDAYAFGSSTYHGEMLQAMKTFLFIAEKANLEGRTGGAFGSFGWSGEANDRIFDTMKHILKMDMVGDTLRLKSSSLEGGLQMAQDYGREIAKKLG